MGDGRLDIAVQRSHRWLNFVHTWLLVGGALALLAATAYVFSGPRGVFWALMAGALFVAIARNVSPAAILALYRAKPMDSATFPEGARLVALLAERAGLPVEPKLFYVRSKMMNAFAVGRGAEAAICITDGLLRGLTVRQLAGVLAHEMSHIRNQDLNVMAIADAVSRLTSLMSTIGIFAVFFNLPMMLAGKTTFPWLGIFVLIASPTVGALLQLALSRTREYDADLEAAAITGDPEGLASALLVLEEKQGRFWEMTMPGGRIPQPSVLRTHPETKDRVARLMALAGRVGAPVVPTEKRPRVTSVPVVRGPRIRLSAMGLYY
ncbi:MAG: zinc metalloprotease HtpX [Flavobacteriaceae bacterium]